MNIIIKAGLILLLFSALAFAQQEAGCTKSKCHDDIGKKEFIHGPVGAGICTVCHNKVEGKDHQFVFSAEKDELCFACHEPSRDMMLENHLHTPVSEGNCVGCHDPHQSDFRYTLKGKASDLCFNCHNEENFSKEYIHGPIGAGDCNACHNPHASENVHQLIDAPEQICYVCHKEQDNIPDMRHAHPPVAEKCVNCHNPHSNDAKFLLAENAPQLCYGCHENIATYANVTHKHEPVANGQCEKCHNVHGSDNPKLFPVPQTDLCFSCHSELGEYVNSQTHKHGPVQQGDCNACHDPHGSDFFKNLRKYFPEEFYKPFAVENYAICFECHNSQVANDEKTTSLTNFREKDLNLHFLHVNKDVKGRSCKSCHQAHASDQEKHIRVSVPFGSMNWELPVTYTRTNNGGSCVVGCHGPKEYSRE
jgi:predicted CXXCH cytochrome family protein